MATCEEERKTYIVKKEVEDAEKLEKIQMYARNTLRPFDFTDEELFQVCECIISLIAPPVSPCLLRLSPSSQPPPARQAAAPSGAPRLS